jgi:hypothetical protein
MTSRPVRLSAQDAALSRRRGGFDSRTGHCNRNQYRAEVHLGARLPWEQEVLGSTPRRPTSREVVEDWWSCGPDKAVALSSILRATTETNYGDHDHGRSIETHATEPFSAPWCQRITYSPFKRIDERSNRSGAIDDDREPGDEVWST